MNVRINVSFNLPLTRGRYIQLPTGFCVRWPRIFTFQVLGIGFILDARRYAEEGARAVRLSLIHWRVQDPVLMNAIIREIKFRTIWGPQ